MAPQPKSYTRTVSAGEERLLIQAFAAKEDWSFCILHQEFDGATFRTVARGASARYPDFESAKAAVEKAVQGSVKFDWPAKEPSQAWRNLARNVRERKIYDPKKGR